MDVSALVSKLESAAGQAEGFLQSHRDLIDAVKSHVAELQRPKTKDEVLAEVSRLLDVLKTW